MTLPNVCLCSHMLWRANRATVNFIAILHAQKTQKRAKGRDFDRTEIHECETKTQQWKFALFLFLMLPIHPRLSRAKWMKDTPLKSHVTAAENFFCCAVHNGAAWKFSLKESYFPSQRKKLCFVALYFIFILTTEFAAFRKNSSLQKCIWHCTLPTNERTTTMCDIGEATISQQQWEKGAKIFFEHFQVVKM